MTQSQNNAPAHRWFRRIPSLRNIVVGAVVGIVVGTCCWIFRLSSPPLSVADKKVAEKQVAQKSTPMLAADPNTLDFGTVWSNEHFPWAIDVKNVAARRIQVVSLEKSCTCTSVEPSTFALEPGERTTLRLNLNLESNQHSGQRSSNFSVFLSAYEGKGDDHPIAQMHLQGVVKRPFSLNPPKIDFGDSLVEGQPFRTTRVDVASYEQCRQLDVEADSSYATAVVTKNGDDNQHFQIEIAPSQSLQVGVHEFKLTVSAVLATGQCLPPISIPVTARIVPDIEVLPSLTHVGGMKIGDVRQLEMTLASRSGLPFKVEKVQSVATDVTLTPSSGPPIAPMHSYRIKIRCSRTGPNDCQVDFRVNSRSPSIVSAHLNYYGVK